MTPSEFLAGIPIYVVETDDCDFCIPRTFGEAKDRAPIQVRTCEPHLVELKSIIERKQAARRR